MNADQIPQHWSILLITNKQKASRRSAFRKERNNWQEHDDECSIHNSECVNQSGQSGRLISTAGVVEKISGE
jgi:hypothetical protein